MKKYQNKYRIPSARASWWDYGWNAAYFITICTNDRKCWFGKIIESQNSANSKKMDFSAMGHIANSCWHEIPSHFPFVELGAHIIMPNHVHGILIINKPNDIPSPQSKSKMENDQPKNQFGPQSKKFGIHYSGI